ncbi:MAG: hypothetical protein K2X03_00050 [Bryobacteraceae bacterium]|nr:hypothetical protein [Bryobacteraceae bacterium]
MTEADYLLQLWDAAAPRANRREWLYLHGYAQRYPDHVQLENGPSLIEELSRANTSLSGWDATWRTEAYVEGRVLASRQGARRFFAPGEYLTQGGPGHLTQPGETIQVHAARESRTLQDAFYFAFGETVAPREDGQKLRLYWNVRHAGAVPLMASLTRHLNRFQIPFRFKCVHRASHFVRLDAAVLYLDRGYWPCAAPLLRRVWEEVGDGLSAPGPLFTRKLAPGLALAEDPPGGASFGRHRCARLAEAIERCPAGTRSERLAALASAFAGQGLNPDAPHLNPGSQDTYDFA